MRFLKIPVETISRYSGYLEISRLTFHLNRFSFTVKEQENSPRKVYSIDTGLSNAVGFRFTEGLGKIAENLVFLELLRKKMKSRNIEIFYWKNTQQREVDFLLKEDRDIKELIQVCWDISDQKTKERELKSLLKAMKVFDMNKGTIITEDFSGEEKIQERKIIYKPLWKWLLQNQ